MDNELVKYDYETKPLRSREYMKQDTRNKRLNKKISLLERVFPGTDLLSWQSAAATIWSWLANDRIEDAHRAGLMPTLIIDRKDLPKHRGVDGDLSIMHGENLWSYRYSRNGNIIDNLVTTRTEIRIYHRALMDLIHTYWHGRAPIEVYQILMAHVLIHEMMHYITTSKLWADQFEDGADSNQAYGKLVHHVFCRAGTIEDEISNERITIDVLKKLTLMGLDDQFGDNMLLPKLCGPYDLFKRSKNPEYRRRMDAYEVAVTLLGSYYLKHAGLNENIDWDNRFWSIIEHQKKEARANHQHVIVVD